MAPHPGDEAPRWVESVIERLIEHYPDLSIPDMPSVPPEMRDRPADAELVKRILSRDPICQIPGCRHIAERAHPIRFVEHGGPTFEANLVGLCALHHHMVHAGLILVSGTAFDLRISDAQRRPPIVFSVSQGPLVQIETERASGPSIPEGPLEEGLQDEAERPAPPPSASLPAEIDRVFWRAHRLGFQWSEKRKALTYRPELGEEPLDEADPALAARSMGIELTAEAAEVLARGARGTPRLLLAHLFRARDHAQMEGTSITASVARSALERAGFDRSGLSETDRRILEILHDRGRPIGVRSLSDILGESPRTVSEVYEPYLLREGYLARTWRGRIATEKAGRALLLSAIDGLEFDFGDLGRISKG